MMFERWRHYARGWLLHFFGRENEAFEAYSKAFHLDPMDVRPAQSLAAIAASRQQFDIAEKWFEVVLALCPDDGASWFNLGFVREQAGKPTMAIIAFTEATRLVPHQDRAWYGMGLAHAQLGQHSAAAAALDQAARLQPMNDSAWYQLGMAWHHAGRPAEVTRIVMHLVDFEPNRARKLATDTGRVDLLERLPQRPF